MTQKPIPPGGGGPFEQITLKDALEERYLSYALSTIMGRLAGENRASAGCGRGPTLCRDSADPQ